MFKACVIYKFIETVVGLFKAILRNVLTIFDQSESISYRSMPKMAQKLISFYLDHQFMVAALQTAQRTHYIVSGR